MRIVIIGTGYVGLTTGVTLAKLGHYVTCVEHDASKLAILQQGKSPIFEPGLQELLTEVFTKGSIVFTSNTTEAVKQAAVIYICVNTPPRADGSADLKYIDLAAQQIAQALNGEYQVIVDKSTVPVNTAQKVRETIKRYAPTAAQFDVVSNPEFLREGTAVHDSFHPDRIVIGADSDQAKQVMLQVYEKLIADAGPAVKLVSVKSAELIKHSANSFLATKISFANMVAEVCEQVGTDALEVLEAIGLDPRIGKQFLQPGIGFGGSCFPKDLTAFSKTLEILGIDSGLLQAVNHLNEHSYKRFVAKIEKDLWVLDGKAITILGLAFKPNTDDIRNAPAIKICKTLLAGGAILTVHDPQAMKRAQAELPEVAFASDPYEAVRGSEALVICTAWDEYKNLDLGKIKSLMINPVIFDGRNAVDPHQAKTHGFRYFGVGR